MVHKTTIISLKLEIKLLWIVFYHAWEFKNCTDLVLPPCCPYWKSSFGMRLLKSSAKPCSSLPTDLKSCIVFLLPCQNVQITTCRELAYSPRSWENPLSFCFTEPKIYSHFRKLLTGSARFILIFNKTKAWEKSITTYHMTACWQVLSQDNTVIVAQWFQVRIAQWSDCSWRRPVII